MRRRRSKRTSTLTAVILEAATLLALVAIAQPSWMRALPEVDAIRAAVVAQDPEPTGDPVFTSDSVPTSSREPTGDFLPQVSQSASGGVVDQTTGRPMPWPPDARSRHAGAYTAARPSGFVAPIYPPDSSAWYGQTYR